MRCFSFLFCVFYFLFFSFFIHAQNTNAYLIPRTVFVGDPASLILPLSGLKSGDSNVILTPDHPGFPVDPDIDFHRIVLERQASGSRLIIEFTAFIPGRLELPAIEIGNERFGGLSVTINSIINTDKSRTDMELSSAASPLAMPGTAGMIFFAIASVIFSIVFIVWFSFRGRRYMHKWIVIYKRWRLFASMKKTERRLHRALLKGKNKRFILNKLSNKFRSFLSSFTDINCFVMTANEMEALPANLDSVFLGRFFRRCDELRFSGADAAASEILPLLDDLSLFIEELRAGEKPS